MALRIPPRRTPQLVTLVQALNHICSEMLETAESGPRPTDLASIIARDERMVRQQEERDALTADVADVLLEAIKEERLKVEGIPPFELNNWLSRIHIFDWQTDRFTLARADIPVSLRQYHTPLVNLNQAVALFEEKPAASAAGEEPKEKRKAGKQPAIKEAIKARILAALSTGRDIGDRDHDAITAEFGGGAARGTCVAALREALSEFRRE